MEAGGGGDNERSLVQILVSMLVSVGKGGAEDDDIPWWREGGLMIPWGKQICTCLFLFMRIK